MAAFVETQPRPRIWPALVIVAIMWAVILVARNQPTELVFIFAQFLAPLIATALFVVWWLFASRLPWSDRVLVLAAWAAIGVLAFMLYDASFNVVGTIFAAVPTVLTCWAGWLLLSTPLSWPVRRAVLIVVFGMAWGYYTLVRFDGMDGEMQAATSYRWKPTAETKYLAGQPSATPAKVGTPAAVMEVAAGDWPEFRGQRRDSRVLGVQLATDFQKDPPKQVWRQRVGPGWSSFAVVGNLLYTQEQRGQTEVVRCLDATTGQEIWAHQDTARFSEPLAGAGPRATPTFHAGKIYSLGATGQLNCLNAADGKPAWSANIVKDSGAAIPMWGFSASPLVLQGVVTVFAGGPEGKAVVGYDAASGALKWTAGVGSHSYCSTQAATIAGVEQVVVSSNQGLSSFDPASGKVLWHHSWPLDKDMYRVIQPNLVGDSDFLIGTWLTEGTRRVHVERDGENWKTSEVWTTKAIKPYYNDLVVHKGHIYGFDSAFLICVSLDTQKVLWKVRGYGAGQVLLLPDQDLLLMLSEKGDVALIATDPTGHRELSKFPAIEGKTWNHPVLVRGKLFVRNGEEAACYELVPKAGEGAR